MTIALSTAMSTPSPADLRGVDGSLARSRTRAALRCAARLRAARAEGRVSNRNTAGANAPADNVIGTTLGIRSSGRPQS